MNEDLEYLEDKKSKDKRCMEQLKNQVSDLDSKLQTNDDMLKIKEKELDKLKDKLSEEIEQKNYIENTFNSILSILNSKSDDDKNLIEFRNIITDENYKNMDSLFSELKKIEKELEEIVKNPSIYTRKIVAIGGAFSSGKSSFINTLFDNGNDFTLPTDDIPMTSIPSYIIDNDKSYIECLTKHNQKSIIDKSIFDKISVKNSADIKGTVNPKSIIKYFYINDKLKEHVKNICFIDTPGYNPGNESKEDREISKEHIINTNNLIWLINVTGGTITKDDLLFLKEILLENPKIQIYIVVNRADSRSSAEIKEICDKIDAELDRNKIYVAGISPYTSHNKKLQLNNNYYTNFKYGISLPSFFKKLNVKSNEKYESIKNNLDNIFVNYRKLFENEIEILETYKKELLGIDNKYKSNIAYMKNLAYKYRGMLTYEYLKFDNGIDNNMQKNIKDINTNINVMKNGLDKKIGEYRLCINNSDKIYSDILKCVNNIFNIS